MAAANYVWVWIKIRRLDQQFETDSPEVPESLQQVLLPHVNTFQELKSMVYSWPGLRDDTQKCIKLRRHDGALLPLSELYRGSTKDQPFILDVVNLYQSTIKQKEKDEAKGKKETDIRVKQVTDDLEEAYNHRLDVLESRIAAAEARGVDVITSNEQKVAETAKKLSETIDFLSRRIDEMSPAEWKDQLKPS